jgi:hypothetical protein
MSVAFAVYTSDPNLLPCVVQRLEGQVSISGFEPLNSASVGSYAQENVLLQRFSLGELPSKLAQLLPQQKSEALLYRAQMLPLGMSLEKSEPLRSRRWLFSHVGMLNAFAELKPRLVAELPDYLRRMLGGEAEGELAFALFLKLLREVGWAEDRAIAPSAIARVLGRTARRLQELSSAAGAARTSSINFIATNRQSLVATRLGAQPIFYTLLEGSDRCAACGLMSTTPATEPKIRAHLRQRTVAVATHVAPAASGWVELPSGLALAVDWTLGLHTATF